MGAPKPRVDAHAKVTGAARYPADQPIGNPAYGFLKTSAIAKGRISGIDEAPARAVPGVLEILTYRNASEIKPLKIFNDGGTGSTSIAPLSGPKIWHDGQIVALVVAETFEAAREAAHRLRIDYEAERPSASFGSAGATTEAASEASKKHEDPKVGDAQAAFDAAAVKIDAEYATPTQHHNPIELFSTTCVWQGDELTIHEPSQFVYGLKNGVAEQLGIDPAKVHNGQPLHRRRLRLESLGHATHRDRRARGETPEPTGQAGAAAPARLHGCDLPRRDAAPRAAGGGPRWQACRLPP